MLSARLAGALVAVLCLSPPALAFEVQSGGVALAPPSSAPALNGRGGGFGAAALRFPPWMGRDADQSSGAGARGDGAGRERQALLKALVPAGGSAAASPTRPSGPSGSGLDFSDESATRRSLGLAR